VRRHGQTDLAVGDRGDSYASFAVRRIARPQPATPRLYSFSLAAPVVLGVVTFFLAPALF
jgi:hypothetical protein